MNDEYELGPDLITITDEDGVEYELEILTTVDYNGSVYYALVPADAEDDEELEISILKAETENGEEFLSVVDDDDELEAVYAVLTEQLYEDDGQDEDDSPIEERDV